MIILDYIATSGGWAVVYICFYTGCCLFTLSGYKLRSFVYLVLLQAEVVCLPCLVTS